MDAGCRPRAEPSHRGLHQRARSPGDCLLGVASDWLLLPFVGAMSSYSSNNEFRRVGQPSHRHLRAGHHQLRSRRRTDFMRADQRRDRALGHQPPRRTPACAAGGGARSSRLLWLLIAPIASAKFTRVSDTDVDVLAQAELVSGHALWGVSPRFFYRVHLEHLSRRLPGPARSELPVPRGVLARREQGAAAGGRRGLPEDQEARRPEAPQAPEPPTSQSAPRRPQERSSGRERPTEPRQVDRSLKWGSVGHRWRRSQATTSCAPTA